MKTGRIIKRTVIDFRIEVEEAPEVAVAGWAEGTITFDPIHITGAWASDSYPATRFVTVYGASKFGPLTQEFALDPESTMRLQPLAPLWVLDALEEAGIEY